MSDDLFEDEPLDEVLEVGSEVVHNLLGRGTVLAVGSTQAVMEGVLGVGQDFKSLNVRTDQVLFCFKKREKRGRSWITVTKTRPVSASAVLPLPQDCAQDVAPEDHTPTAFDGMAAATVESNAFTHGLDPPELAAHHRKRKVEHLRGAAAKRGRNTIPRRFNSKLIWQSKYH